MLDWLKQRLVDIVGWFSDIFVAIFVALWDILRDVVCWVVEQFLSIAVSVAGALDVSGITAYVGNWGTLPAEITNIMGLIGFGDAAAIISAACVIRLLLQLIPFTRLGS
jgi:hypothetical protein